LYGAVRTGTIDKGAIQIELLHSTPFFLRDEDVAPAIDRDIGRLAELRRTRAGTAPLVEEISVEVEDLDPVAEIGDVNAPGARIDRSGHFIELAVPRTRGSPFEQEAVIGRELLHPVVEQIEHIQVAIGVEAEITNAAGIAWVVESKLPRPSASTAERFEPGPIGGVDFYRIG